MSAAANRTKSRAEKREKNRKSSKQRRDEIAYYVAEAKQKYPALALTPAQASNLRIFVKYGKMEVEQGVRALALTPNVSKIRNADDMKQWLTDIIEAMPIAAKLLEEMPPAPAAPTDAAATPAPPTDAAPPAPPTDAAAPTPNPAPPTDAAAPTPTPAPPAEELKPLSDTENAHVRASEFDGFNFGYNTDDDLLSDAEEQRILKALNDDNDENGTQEDLNYISGLDPDPKITVEAPGANVCAPNYFKLTL
jgi:hypothetical protein